MHDNDDNPYAVPVPDEWSPERAEAVIAFLEAIVEALHRTYDMSIIAMWNDRRQARVRAPDIRCDRDDDLPF
ncbi:MAG: hypothetical protein HY828_06020 [Actinobacteria bacterium]|nr:hypothetical protein [Actinomycetota bacterium]